uniref:acyltransferase family protein n=1 Tax=Eubacterium cellulosolvens TaxID=29322 RepID=UPI0004839A8D|nr:acyltransferase family protein [[Eubacterium] cellulosolvens]
MSGKSRIVEIDILKGLCMLFVVLGHAGFFKSIGVMWMFSAFYMPCFFLLSGLLANFDKYNFKTYVNKQIKRLIIPYFFWAFFHLLIMIVVNSIRHDTNSTEYIKGVFWDNNIHFPIAGALWFVSSVFFVSIGCFLLYSVVGSVYLRVTIIIIVVYIGLYVRPFLPWSMDSGLVAFGFFSVGFFWKNMIMKFMKKSENGYMLFFLKYGIVVALTYFIISYFNRYVNVRICEYGKNPMVFFVNALLGCVFFGLVSCGLSKLGRKSRIFKSIIVDWLASVGKNSMIYICINQIIVIAVRKIFQVGESTIRMLFCGIITMVIIHFFNSFLLNFPNKQIRDNYKIIVGA